jgi:hypothetical protein
MADADASIIYDSYSGSLYLTTADLGPNSRPNHWHAAAPRRSHWQGIGQHRQSRAAVIAADPASTVVTLVGDAADKHRPKSHDIETMVLTLRHPARHRRC